MRVLTKIVGHKSTNYFVYLTQLSGVTQMFRKDQKKEEKRPRFTFDKCEVSTAGLEPWLGSVSQRRSLRL